MSQECWFEWKNLCPKIIESFDALHAASGTRSKIGRRESLGTRLTLLFNAESGRMYVTGGTTVMSYYILPAHYESMTTAGSLWTSICNVQ